MEAGMKRLVLVAALGCLLTAGCESAAGGFDSFEVTVNVLGAGSGDGLVTEIETVLDIRCHILHGEPNQLSEVNTTKPLPLGIHRLNGWVGHSPRPADEGTNSVCWTGDCESVQGNVCQMSFVIRIGVTLTASRSSGRRLDYVLLRPSLSDPHRVAKCKQRSAKPP
jgi:hypothetical protein